MDADQLFISSPSSSRPKCLDVSGPKDADGTNLRLSTCNATNKNQKFDFIDGADQKSNARVFDYILEF